MLSYDNIYKIYCYIPNYYDSNIIYLTYTQTFNRKIFLVMSNI